MTHKFIFFCILVVLIIGSCGIEGDYPILTPPGRWDTSDIDNFFEFEILATNGDPLEEPDFRGFEIYYKFYSLTPDGTTLLTNESNLKSLKDVTDHKYRRITRYNNEIDADIKSDFSKPLIKIPPLSRGVASIVRIDFSSLTNPVVTGSTITDGQLGIRRGVFEPDDSVYFKAFDDPDDEDLDLEDLDSITVNVVLSIYVFSFGKKDASTPLHSEAVHLSNIKINL